jgi:hypothetical protein
MRDRLLCPLHYDTSQKGHCYDDETFSLSMIYLSSEELSSLLIARKMRQESILLFIPKKKSKKKRAKKGVF